MNSLDAPSELDTSATARTLTTEPTATSPTTETAELPPSTPTSRRNEQAAVQNDLIMEPYVTSRDQEYHRNQRQTTRSRRGNNRLRRPSFLDENLIEPLQPGPTYKQYKKFFTISSNSGCHLSGIDVIAANREIEKILKGKPTKITETRNGTLLVEVASLQQSKAITMIKTLAGVPVSVATHERLNESRGTIWYPNRPNYTDEDLLAELTQHGVKSVYRTKRKEHGVLVPTPVYVLTFDGCHLPLHVAIGWTRCQVRQYFPRPRRCFKCQGFGHGATSCRQPTATCANCAQEQHDPPCTHPVKCSNCKKAHPASSSACHFYKMEEEIIATQTRERISYGEAKRTVMSRYVTPRISFAEATRLPANPSTESGTRNENPQPPARVANTSDGSTQTLPEDTGKRPWQTRETAETKQDKINLDKTDARPNVIPRPQPKEPSASNTLRKRPQSSPSPPAKAPQAKTSKTHPLARHCPGEDQPAEISEAGPSREKFRKLGDASAVYRVRSLERVTKVPEMSSDILNKFPIPQHFPLAPPPHPRVEMRTWNDKTGDKKQTGRNPAPTTTTTNPKPSQQGGDTREKNRNRHGTDNHPME